jgi:two-component system, LytTR family, sensor kinase
MSAMLFHHRYRYVFMLLLASYAYLNTAICNVYGYFKIEINWYHALLTIVGVTLLTWEGNRLLKPTIKERFLKPGNKFTFLGVFFLVGNVVALLAAFVMVYLVGNVLYGYTWQQNWNPLKLNFIYATLINLFLHLVNAILFFFREYKHKWSEAEALRRSSEEAQMQLVRSQINPHFLFNNLNVLSGMVIKDNPAANHFIEEFCKVYRYILKNQHKELVDLKTELDFIEPYLFLLQKRFDDSIQVKMNIAEPYKKLHVVPAAIQMLIENAIKHNVVSRQRPLTIDIHTNGNNTLVISNNLQPRLVKEPSTQTGLKNIRKRYELISGQAVIINEQEGQYEVVIPLLHLN